MANKYKYNYTFEELREEEDREVLNDYYRQKTKYYESLTDINSMLIGVLEEMTVEELKNTAAFALISPVNRLK